VQGKKYITSRGDINSHLDLNPKKKMNRNHVSLSIVFALAYIITGCSTDINLNAPYKAVPIVFGLIDQSADTQYIKINKSFAGDGNNTTYAGINDSVLFQNLSAQVKEVVNGNAVNTYPLQSKWVKNIKDGIFYGDSQKVYYFVPTTININAIYQLEGSANEGAIEFSGSTKPVGNIAFTTLFRNNITPIVPVTNNSNSGIKLATANSSTNNQYLNVTATWLSVANGKRYEFELHFFYFEHSTNNGVQRKMINWKFGSQTTPNTNGGSSMSQEIRGDAFYQMVQSRLANDLNEANIIKRVPDRFEFVVTVVDEDMNTFIEVNRPSMGIVTERPSFTNIEGGIGIFSSRYTENYNQGGLGQKLMLNKVSLEELIIGQYTSGFKFCSEEPYHSDPPFVCQ
jgi:hypothetical protein